MKDFRWFMVAAIALSCIAKVACAGAGEQYIEAHNELIHMLSERCVAAGVATNELVWKDIASTNAAESSVTQEDLNVMRAKVITLMSAHFVVADVGSTMTNTTAQEAFPNGLRYTNGVLMQPSLMNGIGQNGVFTKVPGAYTDSGVGIYTNDFTDVPLLWVHFHELWTALSCMKTTRNSSKATLPNGWHKYYYGYCRQSSGWPDPYCGLAQSGYESAGMGPRGHLSVYHRHSGGQECYDTDAVRHSTPYRVTNLTDRIEHTVFFYNYAVPYGDWNPNGALVAENDWMLWDVKVLSLATSIVSLTLGPVGLLDCCGDPAENTSATCGFFVSAIAVVVEWHNLYQAALVNPASSDSDEDGLAYIGCSSCSGNGTACLLSPTTSWKDGANNGASARFPLGVSSALTNGGIQVRAYVEEYQASGAVRQMFSLDTRVLAHETNGVEGWEFVTVKRPSGAEVTFALSGSQGGRPVDSGRSYRARRTGGNDIEIVFPASAHIVHRFEGGADITEVYPQAQPDLRIQGSSGSWPGMTTYRNGDQVTSNVCPVVIAVPSYSGDLLNHVAYADPAGNPIADLSVIPGSRIYLLSDANGDPIRETRFISEPSGRTNEIWEGVTTNGGLVSVARKTIRVLDRETTNGTMSLTETVVLHPDSPGAETSVTVTVSGTFPWGDAPLSRTEGYGAPEARTTTYAYYTNTGENGYGRLSLTQYPDGSWVRHEYDEQGRETAGVTPLGSVDSTAASNLCRVTRNRYAGDPVLSGLGFPSDNTYTNDERPRLIVEEVAGYEVSRTFHAYFPDHKVEKRGCTPDATYDDPDNVVTVVRYYTNGVANGRLSCVERPDGTQTLYAYAHDEASGVLTTTEETGAESGGSVVDGIRTISAVNEAGNTLYTRQEDIASGKTISLVTNTYDGQHRLLVTSNALTGAATEYTYSCCDAPETIRDEEGITTWFVYDELDRQVLSTRLGVTNEATYSVHGGALRAVRSAGGVSLVSTSAYNAVGETIASTDERGFTTTYAYATNDSGERVVTITSPDESARVETRYFDGRLKSVGGTAAHARFYEYGADDDGPFTIEYSGADADAAAWVKTSVNLLGRTWKTLYPDGYAVTNYFDAAGRLVRTSDGLTTTLTEYNARGDVLRTVVDMDGDDTIDPGGSDRITERSSSVVTVGSRDVEKTVTRAYAQSGSDAATEIGAQYRAVDGTIIWSASYGRTTTVEVARNAAAASRTETLTQPDGSQRASSYTNGLLMSVVQKSASGSPVSSVEYAYDAFHRLQSVAKTAASGEARTTAQFYDEGGNVVTQTVTAGAISQTTSHEYDAMGRRVSTTLPDGGTVSYEYADTGELLEQSGARTYPVTYTYDGEGRVATLTTYRNGLGGAGDVTTWVYDEERGWLTAKIYADGTTNGYAYLPNGTLNTRTWARGITTEYIYDAAGSLTGVEYSDATPDVAYTLDRLGRGVVVSDGIGTWTNAYSPDGQLSSVSLPQWPGHWLNYAYDPYGRITNTVLLDPVSSFEFPVSYSYDSAGRLNTVSDGFNLVTYAFAADGRAIASKTFNNGSGDRLTVTNTYDGLNRLLCTETRNMTPETVCSFTYTYNQADQRTTNVLADGSYWVYTYDSLGQVTSGKKYFVDETPVGGAQYEYEFDTIGNRLTAENDVGADALLETYTANELNQYESRTVPGKVLHTGTANSNAVVVIGVQDRKAVAANRQGTYYWQVFDVDNEAGLVATAAVACATMTQVVGTNTNHLVRIESREVLMPETPEEFSYDADGNLLSDGLWAYSWNGESRLIAIESGTAVPAVMKKRLTFEYDFQGRRTRKTVESGYSGGAYSTTNVTTFVWDGWLPIAELGAAFTNLMTWGPDLSGSLQGAGGVGGLLAISLNGTNCFPVFNGNGDVMNLINSTDGAIAAAYEYTPWGQLIRATGPQATNNHFRFSSKWQDDETGWLNFGFRYLSPSLGRFTSRDPTGERDGGGIYVHVLNNPVDHHDYLGLATHKCTFNVVAGHGWLPTPGPNPTSAASETERLVESYLMSPTVGNRATAVSCFSGDINQDIDGDRTLRGPEDRFWDPTTPVFIPNPANPARMVPNPAQRGFLSTADALNALEAKIRNAQTQAVADCGDPNTSCCSVEIRIHCITDVGATGLDFDSFARATGRGRMLCNYRNEYKCGRRRWNRPTL